MSQRQHYTGKAKPHMLIPKTFVTASILNRDNNRHSFCQVTTTQGERMCRHTRTHAHGAIRDLDDVIMMTQAGKLQLSITNKNRRYLNAI